MPPVVLCHRCHSTEHDWTELSGLGSIYPFTVVHHAFAPYFRDVVPYGIALIELDGAPQVRLVTAIVDSDLESIRVGAAVEIAWDDVDEQTTIPRAKLVDL